MQTHSVVRLESKTWANPREDHPRASCFEAHQGPWDSREERHRRRFLRYISASWCLHGTVADPGSEQHYIPDRRLKRGPETVGATLSMSVGGRVKAKRAVEPGGAQADETAQIPGAQLFSQGEAATETDGQIPLRHGEVERPVHLSPRRRREAHPHEAHEEAEPFHGADES